MRAYYQLRDPATDDVTEPLSEAYAKALFIKSDGNLIVERVTVTSPHAHQQVWMKIVEENRKKAAAKEAKS